MKSHLVSENERTNMPFTEVGNKDFPTKVIDVDKVAKRLRDQRLKNDESPYIRIELKVPDRHKDRHYTFTYDKDIITGIHYCIVASIHPDGNPKWMKIALGESDVFNINNSLDARK